MSDAALLAVEAGAFVLLLALLAWVADRWEGRARRDARRRNRP